MDNQFAAGLDSGEDDAGSSANSGGFKQEFDDASDTIQLNEKDIIILNDFSVVPAGADGIIVDYNQIDKVEPTAPSQSELGTTSTVTSVIHPPPITNNSLTAPPIAPILTINQTPPLPAAAAFATLSSNPLVPISATRHRNVTTTNYEIVDSIANPVSIPDVDGAAGTLFGSVFGGMAAAFSDEQMQQLLDATAITVTDGGQADTIAEGGAHGLPTHHQIADHRPGASPLPFRDITNTHGLIPVGVLQTPPPPATDAGNPPFGQQPTAPANGLGASRMRHRHDDGGADDDAGIDLADGGGDVTEYSMFIKSEGLPRLEDLDVPHFIKQRYVDGKQSKIWQCGVCEKEFGHQYILMRHLPTHTDERKFVCNICNKAFRQMSTLSQHRAIHSADRPYICEVCEKTFNRVSTLISHRKTHTGLKPHQCHLCNKAFHQKGNLRNHIFTHTNERPYKCDVCQKGFNQMSNLMCHKLKAHQRADKPKYNCQTCGKEFHKRMCLRNHEQYEHGDNGGAAGNPAQRIKYTNGVLIDRISTAAMQLALDTNEIPFALLKPLNGIPVLVRALPAGEKQLLVPATADDLKRHGHIIIGGKQNVFRMDQDNGLKSTGNVVDIKTLDNDKENKNSKVQIRIPVVATVVQRMDMDGVMRMDVESPGPTPCDNYGPQEINVGAFNPTSEEIDCNDNKIKNDSDVLVETATTSLLKPKQPNMNTHGSPIDDNMDVEQSSSSNRIIETPLSNIVVIHKVGQDSSDGYFDITTSAIDGKRTDGMGQFDSGVFSADDADQAYCEMFEILRKSDITEVDLTGDDNQMAF